MRHNVGFISDRITTEAFTGDMIRGGVAMAQKHGRLLFIGETQGDSAIELDVTQSMLDWGVAGFVYAAMYTAGGDPPGIAGRPSGGAAELYEPQASHPTILPDENAAGRNAALILLERGHHDRIVLVGGARDVIRHGVFAARERLDGIEQALTAAGAELAGFIASAWQPDLAFDAVSEFLAGRWYGVRLRVSERQGRLRHVPGDRRCRTASARGHLGGVLRRLRHRGLVAPWPDQHRDPALRDGPACRGAAGVGECGPRHPSAADADPHSRFGGRACLMNTAELLADGFGRAREVALSVIDGLSVEQLSHRLAPGANTIGWLVWHLLRVQDDHVAEVAGTEQVWTSRGTPAGPACRSTTTRRATGRASRRSARCGSAWRSSASTPTRSPTQTLAYVAGLGPDDLDRVVDDAWDPPVTLAVRLVSVISDDLQHVGQAAFIRGTLE